MDASLYPGTLYPELPGQRLTIQGGLTWKQKLAFSFPLETGGSWRKSPHTISWMPPNGSGDLLTDLQQDGLKFLDLPHPSGHEEQQTQNFLLSPRSCCFCCLQSGLVLSCNLTWLQSPACQRSERPPWRPHQRSGAGSSSSAAAPPASGPARCTAPEGRSQSRYLEGGQVDRGTTGGRNEEHVCRHPNCSFCIFRFN